MKDYYKILQVASDASPEVIQMAYKALAKKYHPDLNPGQEEVMQEKMKDLNEAYEVLSDKDKRWQYNQSFYQNEESSHYSESEPPRNSWTESRIEHKRKQHHKAVKLLQEKAAQGLAADV